MKNIKYIILFAALVFTTAGCKKFLNVTPIEAQSGNNFWKTREEVEGFTNGIYARLRSKVAGTPQFFNGDDRAFFPALEIRGNSINVLSIDGDGANTFNALIGNNMKFIVSRGNRYDNLMKKIMSWKEWYDVIAASNIMYFEIDKVPSSSLQDADRRRYKAEAVFLRNLSYMFICKLFGDAVYYTEAYHSTPLARTPQVEVMKKCIADMTAAKADLPATYNDVSSNGFRPTKATAVALLMHLNMWAAAWDSADKTKYYEAVKTLATELDTYTNYKLLPITPENTLKIFKGRSTENLFGILQDFNYGEGFSLPAGFSYYFSHYPYRGTVTKTASSMAYNKDYISKLYPAGIPDARLTNWFENYDSGTGTFQFKKFANIYTTGSGSAISVTSDDSAIIFRLPDCYLLTAEALAELGDEGGARDFTNRVREAAAAPPIVLGGQDLKDEIYRERCRELIGEGQFFFDLVRTKRVVNSDFTKSPISVANLNAGAWTWPLTISADERSANPYLIGNNFWN
ncbi:RagB/SusD family nutrient uptake outer membrane protein [Pedobacter psychrodurus]|uniref:RagB/SusD family nutrient uptake outer membrane protein n=1 Tax=Pedobacter psychrodurus TaxID=2530456 RepID=A0A4R0PMW8_9SPHI|nr:RagB/SusD family nutrient uptake outer membrane protein [Pedobacter psychrodurus]TCD20378.1 RagB/SusD family nutrient uptake outer membrane protein [Pedobacter psychrodurus]